MRYYLDTEFIDDGRTLELISIGVVAEDGRQLYLISSEFDPARCNAWVTAHVLPHLGVGHHGDAVGYREVGPLSRAEIRDAIGRFVDGDDDARFWTYYGACDWVCVMQLWGTTLGMPAHFPHHAFDLKQWARQLGVRGSLKDLVPQPSGEHCAIADARWNRDVWEYLVKLPPAPLARGV